MRPESNALKNLEHLLEERVGEQMKSSLSWEEPEPFSSAPKEHFDLSCLPSAVGDYARAVADSLAVSPDMVGTCALAALSIAVQAHEVEIKSGWSEPLNLFTAIVAGAGEKKSPVLKAFTQVFDSYATDYNLAHSKDFAASKQQERNLQRKLARAEGDVAKGEIGAEQESVRLAQELADFKPVHPVRFYTGDCTPEKLPRLMSEQSEQFAVVSAEGGIIATIAGRYSGEANADIFCKAFYGETVQVDRIGRETEVLNRPILSMLLCIQPVVLRKLTENKDLTGVGLVDRFLFCVPASSIGKGTFDNPPVPDKTLCVYRNLMQDLLTMRDAPKTLRFSADARKLFADFYDHFQQFTIPSDFENIESWASKHCGVVARIAAILQLAEDGSAVISPDNVLRAIRLSDYFQEQAQRVLRGVVLDGVAVNTTYILSKIRQCVNNIEPDAQGEYKVTFRDLQRRCRRGNFKRKSDYTEPLQELVERGYIQLAEDTEIEKLSFFYVNPRLCQADRRQ